MKTGNKQRKKAQTSRYASVLRELLRASTCQSLKRVYFHLTQHLPQVRCPEDDLFAILPSQYTPE